MIWFGKIKGETLKNFQKKFSKKISKKNFQKKIEDNNDEINYNKYINKFILNRQLLFCIPYKVAIILFQYIA